MLTYITTDTVDLYAGRIGLTERQAGRGRSRSLKPLGGGVYEITGPVQFKPGETIGLEKPDKVTLAKIEPTEEARAELARQEEERVAAMVQAQLDAADEDRFMKELIAACIMVRDSKEGLTQAGIPSTAAIEAIVGCDVTADQRDAAWAIVMEGHENA